MCHNSCMSTEARDICKQVLPNGLVVITETMTHVRSVSVGVWVRNGSRREVPEENGLAHFMEHMVFKGTERRSAEAIARELDSEDVKKERQVVLEEIKMDLDNPEYLLHEIFTSGFWPRHSLGRPILGTPETVRAFNRDSLFTRFRDWFAPDHLVVTAAGNVTHEQVLDLVQREFCFLNDTATTESD